MNAKFRWNYYKHVFLPALYESMKKRSIGSLYYEVWIDLDECFERWFDFMYKYPYLAIGTITNWLVRRDKWYWSDDYVSQLDKAMETMSVEDSFTSVLKNSLKKK